MTCPDYNAFAKDEKIPPEIDRKARECARLHHIPYIQALESCLIDEVVKGTITQMQEERAQDVDMTDADRMATAYKNAIARGKSPSEAFDQAERTRARKGR